MVSPLDSTSSSIPVVAGGVTGQGISETGVFITVEGVIAPDGTIIYGAIIRTADGDVPVLIPPSILDQVLALSPGTVIDFKYADDGKNEFFDRTLVWYKAA